MTRVTAAAVQMSPVLYSREGTIDKIVRTIGDLGRRGVQFATFPETVVPYYPYFSFVQPAFKIVAGREHLRLLGQAVVVPSDATAAIGEACRDAGLVASIGVNERDGATLYNTQLLFDADGGLIQRRRSCRPRTTSAWSGDRATGPACAPSTAGSVASGSWRAGSTTTHWHATP